MKKIAVLTGAGVSAESGLGTYRDNGGLWDNYDPMEVASIEGWHRNPGLILDFYNMQRQKLVGTLPNSAHQDIAALEEDYQVCVITQNVDNLHERAGSSHVVHLHGEVTKVRPEDTFTEADSYSEVHVQDIGYSEINIGDKGDTGAQLRPHIVFFGEAVPKMEEAARQVMQADIVLIVGTSLQVYPAASLYQFAAPDTPIYIIDPAPISLPSSRVHHIQATATQGMKTFIQELQTLQ